MDILDDFRRPKDKEKSIENELEESKYGFVGTCRQYVRISFLSVKLYCRQK